MSTPYTSYPPNQPKRLERSRTDRFVSGVCGGLAKYLNLDPTLVRVGVVVISLFTGVGVLGYLVAWIVMPEEPLHPNPGEVAPHRGGQAHPPQSTWTPAPGQPATTPEPTGSADDVWGPAGAPWEQPQPDVAHQPDPVNPPQDPDKP